MSNPLLLPPNPDSRQVALVESITAKTREGKIRWTRQANAITAKIPGGYQINFVLAATLSFLASVLPAWQLLTIRDIGGNELVRVENAGALNVLIGPGNTPVVVAANALFEAITRGADEDLDEAINTVKNL